MITKRCFKCSGVLPLSEFYVHPKMRDGTLNKCKACTKADAKTTRAKKHDYYLEYDKSRAMLPHRVAARAIYAMRNPAIISAARLKWLARNYDKKRAAGIAWALRNPEKKRAHTLLHRAIRSGRIKRRPCSVYGSTKSHGHHFDYSKPLQVEWLCPKHHSRRHHRIVNL